MIDVQKIAHFLGRGLATTGTMATLVASGSVISMTTASPAAACSSEPYIGSVCIMATNFCPYGYVAANGQTIQTNENQALFSLIYGIYGQTPQSSFVMPDLRGRSPIGSGAGPGLVAINLGAKVGAQQTVLTATQVPLVPHTHPATFAGTGSGTQAVDVPAQAGNLAVSAKLVAKQMAGGTSPVNGAFLGQGSTTGGGQASIYVDPSSVTPSTVSAQLGGLDVQLTGAPGSPKINFNVPTGITGGTVTVSPNQPVSATAAVSTQSPGLGLTLCIAVTGIYPTRP